MRGMLWEDTPTIRYREEGLETDSKGKNFVLPHVPFFMQQSDKDVTMSVPCLQP